MVNTHEVTVRDAVVVKRYTSWERGEYRREWSVLQRIHRHAPGLAPQPLTAHLTARPPSITMSVVPGSPLTAAGAPSRIRDVVAAITALWEIPHAGMAPWQDNLDFARQLTDRPRPATGITAAAYDAASAWWHGPDPEVLRELPRSTVLGHRDPNLGNYLWDGRRIRIIDFEDATVSDPATEVAILMEHLAWRGVDCGSVPVLLGVDEGRLVAARRLWAMFWLSLLLFGGRPAGRNSADAADRQAHRVLTLMQR